LTLQHNNIVDLSGSKQRY